MKRALALALLALAPLGAPAADIAPASTAPRPGAVAYVIPIEGPIDDALLYVLRRGVREANRVGAEVVIFEMDTPGGRVSTAEEILKLLGGIRVPTCTFVNPNAISAGAIIAMGTKRIFMAPGSRIGDAMPILVSPFGGVQEMPESLQEKSTSYVAALIRAAAQENGHDPELAEAMVRRDAAYKIGDEVISKEGRLLTLTNQDAERPVGPEKRPLLSEGTVKGIPELLDRLGLSGVQVRRLEVTPAEKLARWISALSVLLLAGGLLCLYLEYKTPGFGLPGIAGILLLGLWFWGHHVAGLAGLEEIALFIIGVTLLTVEVLFIPGFGFIGVAGIALIFLSLLLGMIERIPGAPLLPSFRDLRPPLAELVGAFAICGVAGWFLARYLPKTNALHHLILETATARTDGFAAAPEDAGLVGLRGTAQTALRPAGIGLFGDRRLDVVTEGEFVEAGAPIVVQQVAGARIVVAPVEGSA
jgi:membrane-bound serine protease (ClpP class)